MRILYRQYHDALLPSDVIELSGRYECHGVHLLAAPRRVRQQWLGHVLDFDEDASAPFVLQLVGEYVIEIVTDIARRLTSEADDGPLLRRVRRFSAQNPGFTSLTQSRARSYWAAYYSS